MEKVWVVGGGATGRRRELAPTVHDGSLSDSFAGYHTKLIRKPRFFTNSRTNAAPQMTLDDVLTGRAQRNIDLLLQAIDSCAGVRSPCAKALFGKDKGVEVKIKGRESNGT